MDSVLLDINEHLAVVTINRPKALNALNAEVMHALDAHFDNLATNDDVSLIVVTGAGDKAFVAGADIKELSTLDGNGAKANSAFGQQVFRKIERLGKPVYAFINGYCLGGGLELAMACHVRHVAENAKMGLPEVTLGLIPGYGGTQRLPRLVGRATALEMMLTGRQVDADEAQTIGLVDGPTRTREAAMSHYSDLARKVAKSATVATGLILELVQVWSEGDPATGQAMENANFGLVATSADAAEGMAAFTERRKPAFKGR